jgi:hypothetical protein
MPTMQPRTDFLLRSPVHNTLLHRETLLVVASSDPEDVALELVADAVAGNLVSHAALHEDAELALIFNLDQFLGTIVGVRNVELHLDGGVVMDVCCCNVSMVVVEIEDGLLVIGIFTSALACLWS